jgi:hypothetical protein
MSSFPNSSDRQCGEILKATVASNTDPKPVSECEIQQFKSNDEMENGGTQKRKLGLSSAFTVWMFFMLIALAIGTTMVCADEGEGGHVLPPKARPHGYSLDRMVSLDALFQTSGNAGGINSRYYPHTPFQILFLDLSQKTPPTTFTVYAGTMFYVPLVAVSDSPPIVGDFPINAKGAEDYFSSPQELGAKGWKITVDDDTTLVGPEYFAGPAVQTNPPLLDGGGTHLYILSVFLTPLRLGTHYIRIQGEFDGAALNGSSFVEDFQYTIFVVP